MEEVIEPVVPTEEVEEPKIEEPVTPVEETPADQLPETRPEIAEE